MTKKCVAMLLLLGLLSSASAQAWIVVHDPTNLIQNLQTKLNTVQMLTNQARQIANDIQMLQNWARELTSLPYCALPQLQIQLAGLDGLLRSASGIAYDINSIKNTFNNTYPAYGASWQPGQAYSTQYDVWLQQTRSGVYNAMVTQGVVTNIPADTATLSNLVSYSQSATGNLQALQAGNQVSALMVKQLMQLEAMVAADGRAMSSFVAQQASSADAAKTDANHFFQHSVPMQKSYSSPGIMQFK
jgi:P-type conjugative transfer protein TrbJ